MMIFGLWCEAIFFYVFSLYCYHDLDDQILAMSLRELAF